MSRASIHSLEYTDTVKYVIFAIASIIFGYGLFCGVRMFLLVRKSADLVTASHAFERRMEGGSPRILVLGDSTGVGTGVSDPKDSIAGRLGTDFPKAFVQNGSVNGWKVADALANFPVVPEKSFDIIVLQIGANDIIRGTPIEEFSVSLDALFKKATTAGKKVYALHSGNVGLAPLFKWPLSWLMSSRTLAYRAEYQRIAAANGVTYVDLHHEYKDDPFKGRPEFYASDLLHLSAKGYDNWYQQLRNAMK